MMILNNLFFLTYVGAICGHILSLYSNDFKGTLPFFQKMFPERATTFYFRVDFLILPVIGALLAFMLLEPQNLKSAIFAGLGWSGMISSILKKQIDEIKTKS